MSAEPRQAINTEAWKQWENRVVSDVFPLRRFLGGSDYSAVFLTEYKAKNLPEVAIKFVPSDAVQADALIAQWRAVARHPHPNLIRLFAVGRCLSGGREFIFVVMEYAEQTLAQLLPQRALKPDEVQELLPPALEALTFLHRNHSVHGQVKPSNFLVVNDQLKLASDNVRPIGTLASSGDKASPYSPPELKDRGLSPAGDIWGLGITLVEALTQRTPAWPDARRETLVLPAGFPESFVDTVQRCLSPAPANRPTAVKLADQYKQKPRARAKPVPQPAVAKAPEKVIAKPTARKRNLLLPAVAAAVLLSLAVWAGLRFLDIQQVQVQPATVLAPAPAVPESAPVAPATPAKSVDQLSGPVSPPPDQLAQDTTSPLVLRQVIPEVPQAARDKIQGHIFVTLRVLVDPAGDVFANLMENPGRSKRFARLAEDAAREWKFVPADGKDARVWLLRFDFSRDGVTTRATAM